MRSNKPLRLGGQFSPLTLALLVTSMALPGCNKVKELTGLGGEEATAEEPKAEGEEPKEASDAAAAEEQEPVAAAEPEPIPVEPMHSGLDLMFSFVPDDEAQYVLVRDLSVIPEYIEEADRFLDGPASKLESSTLAENRDVKEAKEGYEQFKAQSDKILAALQESGLELEEGGAIIRTTKNKSVMIFASEDPQAPAKVAEALGEDASKAEHCKALDGHEGWNVCAEDKATLDAYAPAEDPAALREAFAKKLPGVDLEEANLLADLEVDGGKPIQMALTTLPGQAHLAMAMPEGSDADEVFSAIEPGESKTLANLEPGDGFIWARTKPEVLAKFIETEMKQAPPDVVKMVESMSGEWLLAGSIAPAGMLFKAGMNDTSSFAPVMDFAIAASEDMPKEIPDVPGSKVVFEKTAIDHESTKTDALHLGVTGVQDADILKAFTGLHADAWAFTDDHAFTFAVGPDAKNVGQLIDKEAAGLSDEALAGLPPQLAKGFSNKEIAFAAHVPMDFLHGAHMHKLLAAALKQVPGVKIDEVMAAMGMLAPLSSTTMWFAMPEGAERPVMHFSVQGVGNRATEEGKEALAAAHAVADGTSPDEAFGPLVEKYPNSAMAFAYVARAGTEGPGALVGSGLGAIASVAAVAVPVAMGVRNEALADDLGVKPEDPEPEVVVNTAPKAPTFEPKEDPKPVEPKKPVEPEKPEPKKDEPKKDEPKKPEPKKDPKKDEPKADPKKDEPKKDDPVVEPPKPKPPKPKPSVEKPKPRPAPVRGTVRGVRGGTRTRG